MKKEYLWRVMMKNVCFGLFGIGSLVFSILVFPLMQVFIPNKQKRDEKMRKTIRFSFDSFVHLMQFLKLITVSWNNKVSILSEDSGYIIIANHPSLIDIIILISRIPRGDCIVKHSLFRIPFIGGIVNRLYISNNLDGETLLNTCSRRLEAGNTMIIFPEGTRNQGAGIGEVKRGAARIALHSNQRIIPIRIETSNTKGLRKGDGMFTFKEKGPIDYKINIGDYIYSHDYKDMQPSLAARKLTNEITKAIS